MWIERKIYVSFYYETGEKDGFKKMMELVTGGSGSGKSAYAEERICALHRALSAAKENGGENLSYIATMYPYGAETKEKIADHRMRRAGKGFQTLEWYTDITGKIRQFEAEGRSIGCVLLECISNLTANELYMEEGAKEEAVGDILEAAALLKEKSSHLVVVTNEIFSESSEDSEQMRYYKYVMGTINRELAQMADQVTEVVYGRPVKKKGWNTGEMSGVTEKMSGPAKGIKIVTGGAFQGKRKYAMECYPELNWSSGADCSLDKVGIWEAVDQFHLFVRRWLEAGRGKEQLLEAIGDENRNLVIVSDEIGCGLVPVDAFEREYRETVGRIMTELTAKAVRADRVICGIGQRIK